MFRPPPRVANGGSLQGLLGATHPPRYYLCCYLDVAKRCEFLRTPLKRKFNFADFAEFPFHALRRIKLTRNAARAKAPPERGLLGEWGEPP